MFNVKIEELVEHRLVKYELRSDGSHLSYAQVLDLLASSPAFRCFLTSLLADSPLEAFRWETPPLSQKTVDRQFEFVLINASRFTTRQTDVAAYQDYFTNDDAQQGIVSFPNLSGDSTLIVPSPRTDESVYGHLASFVRQAPDSQIDMLWQMVGKTVRQKLSESPIWLSTAGGGVAWLHVRIDSRPKYYGYAPYKEL